MTLYKMKFQVVFALLISLLAINVANCYDCDQKLGCLMKKKLYVYISSADTRGAGHKMESTTNFKNIFVFRDRIVFYKAALPQENQTEQEVKNLNDDMNEAYIERLIDFRYIILECGRYQNRICHAKELPNIGVSDAFKQIKMKVANADEKCIAFSFFDKAFDELTEKIAIMCITDAIQVKELLAFKNYLSNQIFSYHLSESNTRYDASSGIEISRGHYISYIDNKPVPVFASIRSNSILLTTDDKKREFLKDIKLLALRDTGAYSVRRATDLNKLKDGWGDSLASPPPLDCCIIMPSEDENNLLCIVNSFKKTEIEDKKEKCQFQMTKTLKAIWTNLRKVQFTEKLSKLVHDPRVSSNCASPEYATFKAMIEDAGRAAINIDCKILMQYSPDLFMTKKDYCIKHYSDEMELMTKLLSMKFKSFWTTLKNCLYNSFGIDFSDSFILSIMKKGGIDTDGPKTTSFLQLKYENALEEELGFNSGASAGLGSEMDSEAEASSESNAEEEQAEKDNIDDDDAVVEEKKPAPVIERKSKLSKKKIPYVFAEVSSKTLNSNSQADPAPAPAPTPAADANKDPTGKKLMDIIVYNKPTEKMPPQLVDKIKILRENSMRSLQKTHVWHPAKSERQNEPFSKVKYQQGNKNADLFVSFLGYIRDTSYKQSPPLFEKIKKKFTKL